MKVHLYITIIVVSAVECMGGKERAQTSKNISPEVRQEETAWEQLAGSKVMRALVVYTDADRRLVHIFRLSDERTDWPVVAVKTMREADGEKSRWQFTEFVNNRRGELSVELRDNEIDDIGSALLLIYEHAELIECIALEKGGELKLLSDTPEWNHIVKLYGGNGRFNKDIDLPIIDTENMEKAEERKK